MRRTCSLVDTQMPGTNANLCGMCNFANVCYISAAVSESSAHFNAKAHDGHVKRFLVERFRPETLLPKEGAA